MINRALGIVIKVIQIEDDLELCSVLVDEIEVKAYSFPKEVGHIITNDKVILNTTAVDLCLGSGGFHFIMGRYSSNMIKYIGKGHIMKLRYTPFQLKVCAVEEEDSPYQNKILGVTSIKGVPVIAGSLHSMLIPCVCGIKSVNNALRIGYIMTDGGALPIKISEAVRKLKVHKYLCGTVTVGHSYGGDLEAINLYSGIIAAKEILQAHIIIVLMGPGIVGTGTIWGNTALEVGQIINAVTTLEGTSYTIPRISFSDKRERHFGVQMPTE
ncbi:MAG: DUF3866 family protein [Clostridia bacterium]|nr:DUF3866 family protein [Clostridia bacterium]